MIQQQILSVAIIGKQGQPIYLRNLTPQCGGEADLKWYYAAHTSLDVFDERDALPPKLMDSYLGLLYTIEDYSCYGYQTNTKIKFVLCLALKDVLIRDSDVKAVFRAIHSAYIQHISNPFHNIPIDNLKMLNESIKSKRFDQRINEILGI